MMLFQAPQASHLPDHLEWTAPQDWQTKEAEERAILHSTRFSRPFPLEPPASPPLGERPDRAGHDPGEGDNAQRLEGFVPVSSASSTPSIVSSGCFKNSSFQKRITRKPRACRNAVRSSS